MQTQSKSFLPSTYEYYYVVSAALLVLIAGNFKVLLQHFGLMSSSAVLGDHVSSTIGSGLKALDTFSATPNVVTFMTWGIIGLVLFSVVQAFMKASDTIGFEREVSSNRFVHPANFSRRRYWRTIVLNTFLSFGLITLLILSVVSYVLFVVPVSSLYLQRFLILNDVSRFSALAISLFVIIAGTLLLYLILKAVLWQHRLSQR